MTVFFSRLAVTKGAFVVAADGDHFSINNLYKQAWAGKLAILPLVLDLSEPSPAMGLNGNERPAFSERCRPELVLALALIHHLAIGRHFSFEAIATFFAAMGSRLIIEFVGRDDEKVKDMLLQKSISFDWYTEENFRMAFGKQFAVTDVKQIAGTNRTLYLMRKHAADT